MRLMNKVSVIALCLILCACCEEPIEIPDPLVINTNKTVLVEKLTGVQCGPCGPAGVLLNQIIKNSNGNVIAYGVHGKLQTDPYPESKYDFSYPDACEFETSVTSVNFFGKPGAMFNRILDDNGNLVVNGFSSTWQSLIDTELQKPQIANVELTTAYDSDTRLIDIFVSVRAIEALPGNLSINIVVAENKLIDPQALGNTEIVLDFEHNHVMKESLTELSGDFLANGLSKGELSTPLRYSYTLPEENNGEWTAKNMEIIAFVTSESMNGEVVQSAMAVLPE